MLAARARDFNLARSLWNRTRGAFDDTPAGMLLLSAIDFETGNEEQAAQRLARLVADQPNNRRARRLLAAAQLAARRRRRHGRRACARSPICPTPMPTACR